MSTEPTTKLNGGWSTKYTEGNWAVRLQRMDAHSLKGLQAAYSMYAICHHACQKCQQLDPAKPDRSSLNSISGFPILTSAILTARDGEATLSLWSYSA